MKTSLQYIILTILCSMHVAASDQDANRQPMIEPANVSVQEISEKIQTEKDPQAIDIKVEHIVQKIPSQIFIIDTNHIIENSNAYKDIKNILDTEYKKEETKRHQNQELVNEIREKIKKINTELRQKPHDREANIKREEFLILKKKYSKLKDNIQNDIEIHQTDYQKKITKAKEIVMEKVSFILERDFKDIGATVLTKNNSIIYASKASEITNEVLDKINGELYKIEF